MYRHHCRGRSRMAWSGFPTYRTAGRITRWSRRASWPAPSFRAYGWGIERDETDSRDRRGGSRVSWTARRVPMPAGRQDTLYYALMCVDYSPGRTTRVDSGGPILSFEVERRPVACLAVGPAQGEYGRRRAGYRRRQGSSPRSGWSHIGAGSPISPACPSSNFAGLGLELGVGLRIHAAALGRSVSPSVLPVMFIVGAMAYLRRRYAARSAEPRPPGTLDGGSPIVLQGSTPASRTIAASRRMRRAGCRRAECRRTHPDRPTRLDRLVSRQRR